LVKLPEEMIDDDAAIGRDRMIWEDRRAREEQ